MAFCKNCGSGLGPRDERCSVCGASSGALYEAEAVKARGESEVLDGNAARFSPQPMLITLFLLAVTCGFYFPVWYLARLRSVNTLTEDEALRRWNASMCVFGAAGVVVLLLFFWFGVFYGYLGYVPRCWAVLPLLFLVIAACPSFSFRRILRGYAFVKRGRDARNDVMPSVVLTFVFSLFYVQYHIGEMLSERILLYRC